MARDHKIVSRSDLAFAFAVPSMTSLANSPAINTAKFHQAKTLALSLPADADAESRQVTCEQAGDRSAFLCAVHKLAQYNAALTGADLKQLGEFLADGVFTGIPVAADDRLLTGAYTAATVHALANDTDPDGEVLSVTAVGAAANGAAVLNADGTTIFIPFVPEAHYHEIATFTYQAADRQGCIGQAAETVSVAQVNDAHWLRMTFYQKLKVWMCRFLPTTLRWPRTMP